MASEIIDIVHKFTYEVNDKELRDAAETLKGNVTNVFKLTESLDTLEKKLLQTAASDKKAQQDIQVAITNTKRAIDSQIVSIEKTIQGNKKLQDAVKQTAIAHNQLQTAMIKTSQHANQANNTLLNFSRIASDAPYGIIGIANNISPAIESFQRLSAAAKESGSSIGKELLNSLKGSGGILLAINIAVSLLTVFGSKIMAALSGVKELTEAEKKQVETQKAINQEVGKEIGQLSVLRIAITNTQLPMATRLRAVKELKDQYPDYFKNLTNEALLTNQVGLAYQQATKAIVANARAKVYSGQLGEAAARQEEAQGRFDRGLPAFLKAGGVVDYLTLPDGSKIPSIGLEQRVPADLLKALHDLNKSSFEVSRLTGLIAKAQQEAGNLTIKTETERKEKTKTALDIAIDADEYIRELNESERKINELYAGLYKADQAAGIEITQEQRKIREELYGENQQRISLLREIRINKLKQQFEKDKSKLDDLKREATKLELEFERVQDVIPMFRGGASLENRIRSGSSFRPVPLPENFQDKEKKQHDRRIKLIKATEDAYRELAQVAVSAYNDILSAQQRQLDHDISVQERRVERAKEIAERGNTEILKAEQEKLNELEERRAASVKRQIELNTILQISNTAVALTEAIGAVVAAASEGDPYTIALRVAAAVASLVAGVASIKAAFSQNNTGFAEGGYTGDGGKYEKAGTVHRGEFVISKEKTRQFRPLLEAIHSGKPISDFSAPQTSMNKKELQDISNKMSQLIETTGADRTRVVTNITEGGIYVATERERARQKRKWG